MPSIVLIWVSVWNGIAQEPPTFWEAKRSARSYPKETGSFLRAPDLEKSQAFLKVISKRNRKFLERAPDLLGSQAFHKVIPKRNRKFLERWVWGDRPEFRHPIRMGKEARGLKGTDPFRVLSRKKSAHPNRVFPRQTTQNRSPILARFTNLSCSI